MWIRRQGEVSCKEREKRWHSPSKLRPKKTCLLTTRPWVSSGRCAHEVPSARAYWTSKSKLFLVQGHACLTSIYTSIMNLIITPAWMSFLFFRTPVHYCLHLVGGVGGLTTYYFQLLKANVNLLEKSHNTSHFLYVTPSAPGTKLCSCFTKCTYSYLVKSDHIIDHANV